VIAAGQFCIAIVLACSLGCTVTSPYEQPRNDAPPAPTPDSADVEIVEIGDEPRSVLMLGAPAGASQRLLLSTALAMKLDIEGEQVADASLPSVKLELIATTKRVDDDGAIHLSLETIGADYDAAMGDERSRRAADQAMIVLRALRADVVVQRDGLVRSIDVSVPERAPSDLRPTVEAVLQGIAELFVPLPAEPVGIGARWKATSRLRYTDLDLARALEVRFVSRTAEGVELEVAATRTHDGSGDATPGVRSIERASIASRGSLRLAAGSALPTRAKLRIDSTMSSRVTSQEGDRAATLHLGLDVDLDGA
jgi:hypothetical protein